MRIIKNQIVAKNGSGFVQVQPEQAEDMWHLYNLIAEDDSVRSSTVRNVSIESPTFLTQIDCSPAK